MTEVRARWWTNQRTWFPRWGGRLTEPIAGVQVGRALFRRWRRGPAGSHMALWRSSLSTEAGPDLIFEVRRESLPSDVGEADAVVLGEYAPNGAMCVVIDGSRITPIYNPQAPWGDLTRRLRR